MNPPNDHPSSLGGAVYWRTMVRVLTTERDHWCKMAEQRSYRIDELAERTRALEAENTKLHGQLDALAQRRDPPDGYVVRTPGVYVATPSERSAVGLDVYRHALRDVVVLTDPPGPSDAARWVQFYRDGITGDATAWYYPPDSLQDALRKTWASDLSSQPWGARPWVGIDPAKPGDDLTAAVTVAARDRTLGRIERLETWARQFHPTQSTAILATPIGGRHLAIDPLDHLEHKG